MPEMGSEFQKLSLADKNAYLLDTSPTFQQMAPRDRVDYLTEAHYGAQAPTKPEGGIGARFFGREGFFPSLAENIKGFVGGPLAAIGEPAKTPAEAAASIVPGGLPSKRMLIDPMIEQGRTAYQKLMSGQPFEALGHGVAAGLPMVGPWVAGEAERRGEQAGRGDIAGAVGGALGDVAFGAAVSELPKGLGKIREKFAPTAYAEKGISGITAGAQPKVGKAGQLGEQWTRDLAVAKDHLSKISRESPLTGRTVQQILTGKGEPEHFNEAAANISEYKKTLWKETHEAPLTRQGAAPFDNQGVAKEALSEIKGQDDLAQAEKAKEWVDREIPRIKTLADADERIRLLNQEIKKLPEEYGPVGVRVRQAALESLRNQLDSHLEAFGEQGVKSNNRAWGALRNIENRLQERYYQESGKAARSSPLPQWFHAYVFGGPGHLSYGLGLRPGEMFRPDLTRQFGKGWTAIGRAGLEPEPLPITFPPPYKPPAGGGPLPPVEPGVKGGGVSPPPSPRSGGLFSLPPQGGSLRAGPLGTISVRGPLRMVEPLEERLRGVDQGVDELTRLLKKRR